MKTGEWKNQAFQDQLLLDRDFAKATQIKTRFALCCGHRTASNLLGESLYKTGLAGDPMEYFNLRFLDAYKENNGLQNINVTDYLKEMQRRRTSPNGVFGINIKFDQLAICFKDNWQAGTALIKDNDLVVFLYRKDKLRQAVSLYIGQTRDTFNTPSDVSDDVVKELVSSVPFNPYRITSCLEESIKIDSAWLDFFNKNKVNYIPLAYEDFVSNYAHHIDFILDKLKVPQHERKIPEKPLKKISNNVNDEFRSRYLDLITGNADYPGLDTSKT